MEKSSSLESVINKIEEIRDYLKIGDEVIPFLSDMFRFIQDIMPLMKEANLSLRSGSEKIPDARQRIEDAGHTAELATYEILNKLECISEKLTSLSRELDGSYEAKINTVLENVNDIIYALQFQDITSQKLEHANRILKAIYTKFNELEGASQKVQTGTTIGKEIMREITESLSNPDNLKSQEQLNRDTEDVIRESNISQADIDKMFD